MTVFFISTAHPRRIVHCEICNSDIEYSHLASHTPHIQFFGRREFSYSAFPNRFPLKYLALRTTTDDNVARNPNSFFREVSSALNARPSRHCVVNHFHYSMSMRSIIVVYCVSFLPSSRIRSTDRPTLEWAGVECAPVEHPECLNKSTRTPCQTKNVAVVVGMER